MGGWSWFVPLLILSRVTHAAACSWPGCWPTARVLRRSLSIWSLQQGNQTFVTLAKSSKSTKVEVTSFSQGSASGLAQPHLGAEFCGFRQSQHQPRVKGRRLQKDTNTGRCNPLGAALKQTTRVTAVRETGGCVGANWAERVEDCSRRGQWCPQITAGARRSS